MNRSLMCLVLAGFLSVVSFPVSAQDWPQWRGPKRDGVAPMLKLPERWPSKLTELYRIDAGEGHAGPVVVGGRLFLFFRAKNDEVIRCVDAKFTKQLWEQTYAAGYKVDPAAKSHGPGPKATPTCADGLIYTQGMSSQLHCLEAKTGKVVWTRDLQREYRCEGPQFGTAASILVEGDLIITLVGGTKEGAVVAFDRKNGKEIWKTPCDGPAYCSPVAADLAGTRQVLFFTRAEFLSVSPKDGQILWRIPYTTAYEQNIVTPITYKDLVIISGFGKPCQAFRVTKDGEKLTPREVWKNDKLRMYMSSPVLAGEHLFGHDQSGQIVCLEAKTGRTLWNKGNLGQYVSMILAGDRLLCLDEMAELTVLEANPKEYKEVATYKVSDSATWAHLAIAEGRLFVKDKTRLICYEWPK